MFTGLCPNILKKSQLSTRLGQFSIFTDTLEQHTDAGPEQGLVAGQDVEACTAAEETSLKLGSRKSWDCHPPEFT